jgi:pyruvate/2-oxoglutarate dehydrogenase complex dihydrolipoamide dehydrogenase (E3) component
MADRFDTVILGAGPAGEVALNALAAAGQRLALVEPELIGGECSNWGCIPSKTLLRVSELQAEATRVAGLSTPAVDFSQLAAYRDWMVSGHDDRQKLERYEQRGITVLKERGRIAGHGRVEVDGRLLECDAIVVATGAEAAVPPIPGLREVGFWTNREATAARDLPESMVFIGGGFVAVELAQLYARLGSRVTVVQGPQRLVDREQPRIGELLAEILREDGVELRLGRRAVAALREEGDVSVELDDGERVRGATVVVATGRRPRTADLGLETVGAEVGRLGLRVDGSCRAADGVWAAGDVTGVAPFTHVAKYQARIAARNILGRPCITDYRAVPHVVFTDPELAAVGLSEEDARARGVDAVSIEVDLPSTIARPYTYEREPRGTFGLVADRRRGTLVGAWAIAPLAGEWIHQAVLAIRAELPLSLLEDTIAQFPSFSEAVGSALRSLEAKTGIVDHCAHPRLEWRDARAAV